MSVNKKQRQAYIGLILLTSIIGLSAIFVKIGLRYTNPIDLLAHRFSAAAVSILLLWLVGIVKFPVFNFKKIRGVLLLSLSYPLSFFALQTYGLQHSSASEAGIIFASTPILTLVAAGFFLKERTGFMQKVGIVLSISGILYIIYFTGGVSGSTTLKGLLLLVASVFVMVLYYVLGKHISSKFSAMEITAVMTMLAFVVFNSFSIVYHLKNGTLNLFFQPLVYKEFLWTVFYLGVLSSMFTAFLTNFALSQIPASQVGVFNNISPLISVLGGVIILDERLYFYHIIGGLLVLTGVIMTIYFKRK